MSDIDNLHDLELMLATVDEALLAGSDDRLVDSDKSTLRGVRGLLRLDRYDLTLDPTDLAGAIGDLTAVTAMTHHADWPFGAMPSAPPTFCKRLVGSPRTARRQP